ncbi:MAG: hypothetical protein ACK4TN_07755, partial [Brevinematales bacterium]
PYAYREIARHLHPDVPRVFSYGHDSIAQALALAYLLKVS